MARPNRCEIVGDDEVAVLHVFSRCVRRAFLCGVDPLTGACYDHRKQFIQDRLEALAGVFAIDVMAYAIMSNHFHLVLRTRPDIVAEWSDEEVARRWWALFPKRRTKTQTPAEPRQSELDMLTADPKKIAELRRRLSSVSWLMRCLCESIARQANAEDEVTGRFFEGRFKSVRLNDEASVLACMGYLDLNPVRAKMAETPETSEFTSAYQRILAATQAPSGHAAEAAPSGSATGITTQNTVVSDSVGSTAPASPTADRWLSPVELAREHSHESGDCCHRASNRGCVPISLGDYLVLLDWTGRQIVNGKRGRIPSTVSPILERLGLDRSAWVENVRRFGRRPMKPSPPRNETAAPAPSSTMSAT